MSISEVLMYIILFIIGAILGSFACCQAWRIRLKQVGKKNPGKWSVCLSCGAKLKPSENIPIFSWLAQRGKCKHCGANIGKIEILSELSLGTAMVTFGAYFYPKFVAVIAGTNPLPLIMLSLSVLALITVITVMWILAIYDAKWQELPTKLLVVINICAVIYLILQFAGFFPSSGDIGIFFANLKNPVLSLLGAIAILAGTYFLLYFFSREKLVGSGDWLIAMPIAIILGNWWLALVILFLSNLFGSIYGVYQKVKKSKNQIPFGPFLILAFVIVYISQSWLVSLIAAL
ncbi:prepilin peptidase [Candidatus Saccharibacteria bacterium]|nr:prepilin peptidase [Candidatus Saccharibacteria bacterium]